MTEKYAKVVALLEEEWLKKQHGFLIFLVRKKYQNKDFFKTVFGKSPPNQNSERKDIVKLDSYEK